MQELGDSRYRDDCGYTADMGDCNDLLLQAGPASIGLALEAARRTLESLTAGMFGSCPESVRPCFEQTCCLPSPGVWNGSLPWAPFLVDGTWVNRGCGCGVCAVDGIHVGPVEVVSVRVDGVDVPTANWTVIQERLVSLAGPWPTMQNLATPATEAGTFEVVVRRSITETPFTEKALGQLACEFLKELCGSKCELPKSVRSLVRQGVSMQIEPGAFPGGRTGLRYTDVLIDTINPYGRRTMAAFWSPHQRSGCR